MGASGSKARGLWPFALAAGCSILETAGNEQALVRLRGAALRIHALRLYVEDGDLAHGFYEETIVTKNAKLRWVYKNMIPQGIVKLNLPPSLPRIHMDFPVILYEV
ncbi:tumor suppressor candidate 2-like [Fukomys damarensis]|uniref:tumor suppressor candidate 2-like n=1 Tax=Fukomys damarensis TaxID=885580 RepID=UPI001455D46E|nr:tumor suppressor candidate 2-like [Fukomys damarensis]